MSDLTDLREILCKCGQPVNLAHHDEGFGHQRRCCDCYDLAMGMPAYLVARRKLWKQLPCLEGNYVYLFRRTCQCVNCAYIVASTPVDT